MKFGHNTITGKIKSAIDCRNVSKCTKIARYHTPFFYR